MNTLPLVVAAILAAIATVNGTYVLTASDQVKEGTYTIPVGSTAFAALTPARLTDSVPSGVNPDFYLETYQAEVRLWGAVTTSTTDVHAQRARHLAYQVMAALDNVRTNVGSALFRCVYWRVSQTQPDSAGATVLPGWAHTVLTLEFTFRRQPGTGV